MSKYLIVNADDLGHTDGVSRGILDAHKNGVVSSTSTIIGYPGAAEWVKTAQTTAPTLGIGLHLALSGAGIKPVLPLDQVRTLVNSDGTFYPYEGLLMHLSSFDPEEVRRELTAQMERFIAAAGQPPTHLDSHHQAAYRHPVGLRTMFALAQQYSIPIRNVGVGDGSPQAVSQLVDNLMQPVPVAFRERATGELQALFSGPHPRWPEYQITTFYDQTATLGDLLVYLTTLHDGVTELMCHPGYMDSALLSDYTAKREDELAVLTHRSVKEVIKSEGITLIHYGTFKSL